MFNFEKYSEQGIYRLIDEFPLVSFSDIQTIALSLKIQGIHNENSHLSENNYILLRDKLLLENEDYLLNYNEYIEENEIKIEENKEEEVVAEVETENKEEEDDDEEEVEVEVETEEIEELEIIEVENPISIRKIQLEYKLKEAFIFQSIQELNIKDIKGTTISNDIDTKYIFVNETDCEKIVKKTNELNAFNSMKNNPAIKNMNIHINMMTLDALAKKYSTDVSILVQTANELNIPSIINGKSQASLHNCTKIIANLKRKVESLIVPSPREELNIFEEIIQKNTLVFIDTSSLMNDSMPEVINKEIIPILEKYNKVVFITDSVINEITIKISQLNSDNQQKGLSAKNILSKLVENDLYQIPETHSINKSFADAELITIFTDLRLKYNLCLITNDNSISNGGGLSNSIMELQTSTSIDEKSIKKITVLYVGDNKLMKYSDNRNVNFKLHEKSPIRVVL